MAGFHIWLCVENRQAVCRYPLCEDWDGNDLDWQCSLITSSRTPGYIYSYVLSTDTKLEGDIHLHEERNVFRFAETPDMPLGGEHKRFDGKMSSLPMPFNTLQNTCRYIRSRTRGLEVKLNHLKVNGWTFDSFLRQKADCTMRKAYFDNIRRVTLSGSWTKADLPDENVLHGLMGFGSSHPKADIRVHIAEFRLGEEPRRSLQGFLSLGYCIREAIRGVPRPERFRVQEKRLSSWLRGKAPGELNVENVRLFPHRRSHDQSSFNSNAVYHIVNGKAAYQVALIKAYGDADGVIAFITGCFDEGI